MYTVPYGKGEIEFELPPGMRGTVIEPGHIPPLGDVEGAIAEALAHPVASPPLRELAKAGDKVCLVFTDITRASPDHLLVPALLKELAEAGVREEDVTLLCGVGLHRPSTQEEKVKKLGKEVVARYRVVDHVAWDEKQLVDLGLSASGAPLSFNRLAYEADLLLATGIVEPHQYAGYSGGRKTVAIGAAGEKFIAYTHSPKMVAHPGTRLGSIEGNPFHEALAEAARRAGLRFILNVVLNGKGRVAALRAGEPGAAFAELVEIARRLYEVPIPKQYDVVIAGVGYPKDANLYQASRAASYIYFSPSPVIKRGGFIIVPARCQEGAGEGVGEKRFYQILKEAPEVKKLLAEIEAKGYPPGGQRAFITAKVLAECRVVIVGAERPDVVSDVHMIPAPDMEAALSLAARELGPELDVLIVPHALLTLPRVKRCI